MLCFKERIGVPILLFLIPFLFLAGCESADIQPASDSTQSSLNDSNSIIQTRLDGDHLEVFTLIPPSPDMQAMESIPDEVRAKDFLGGGDVLARNGTGNIRRLYSSWNLVTDEGSSTGARVDLDGEGLYVTDLGAEVTRSRVSLPSQAGTYYYRYLWANTKGSAFDYEYVYTISGDQATLTFGFPGSQSILYQGAPLGSADLGMGILISAFFGQAPEATQDSRYTGTWTITENFNGVTGETGKFDMRRIGIQNLQVEPGEFNPAADEQATISADVVALPVSTELTPDGWTPSGTVEWLIEVDDPAVARSVVRSLTGSVQPSNPDSNGKIATINQVWDGKDNAGMDLLNAEYLFRTQALANLSIGSTISTEIPGAVRVGNRAILIRNLKSEPSNFDPESNETTTLSFTIEAIGFDNPNLSWVVKAYLGEQLVKEFPAGEALSTATKDVSFQWNGRDEVGIPVQGKIEYRIRATACDNEVLAQLSNPVKNRTLFQADGGVCTFEDEVALVVAGSSFLQIEVTPNTVLPSRMYSSLAKLNEVEVTVTLNEMPEGIETFPVDLSVEVIDDVEGPDPPNPPNLPVSLKIKGGHNHDHANRPKDELMDTNHTFQEPGVFRTKLKVSEVGSLLRVKATPSNEIVVDGSAIPPATTTLDVKVPDLVRLEPRPVESREFGYVLTGGAGIDNQLADYGDVTNHPSNHWGNPLLLSTLQEVGLSYMNAKLKAIEDPDFVPTTWEKILVNDISLPRGGVFDVSKIPNWSNPHAEHRDGTVVDARTERSGQDEDFKNLWMEATGLEPIKEGDHLHLRIQGGYAQ